MITSKKDIINIIPLSIEQKEHNIPEFMGIIHLRNFFLHDQPKIHSSNYKIGLGTTKPTTAFIPGYGGYVPTNRFQYNMDYIKDPYFNVNKTNHLLNYMVRIPNYQGYVPKSVTNIKGNQRPHCFSTDGEDFS